MYDEEEIEEEIEENPQYSGTGYSIPSNVLAYDVIARSEYSGTQIYDYIGECVEYSYSGPTLSTTTTIVEYYYGTITGNNNSSADIMFMVWQYDVNGVTTYEWYGYEYFPLTSIESQDTVNALLDSLDVFLNGKLYSIDANGTTVTMYQDSIYTDMVKVKNTPNTFSVFNYLNELKYKALSIETAATSAGNRLRPIYINNGTMTPMSGSVGSNTNPVYINNGKFIACSKTIGSKIQPIYIQNGIITPINHPWRARFCRIIYRNPPTIPILSRFDSAVSTDSSYKYRRLVVLSIPINKQLSIVDGDTGATTTTAMVIGNRMEGRPTIETSDGDIYSYETHGDASPTIYFQTGTVYVWIDINISKTGGVLATLATQPSLNFAISNTVLPNLYTYNAGGGVFVNSVYYGDSDDGIVSARSGGERVTLSLHGYIYNRSDLGYSNATPMQTPEQNLLLTVGRPTAFGSIGQYLTTSNGEISVKINAVNILVL